MVNKKIAAVFRLCLGLALPCFAGCASFQSQWDKTLASPRSPDRLAGPWEGTWRSDSNGHHDELRCLVTKDDGGAYKARFHAKYRKVFTFGYTVPLDVRQTNDLCYFTGSANLGWLAGGVYHYDGSASATNFASTYTSKYDHGVFEMTRPAVAGK
jgi:hypothetical protein